jgi:glutathione S-transferase
MVHYKLYYFNARGRAEPLRLIFAFAGHSFDDVRFERDHWPQYKNHSPTGQAPFLEVSENERLSSAQRQHSAIKTEYNENNFAVSQSAAIGKTINL